MTRSRLGMGIGAKWDKDRSVNHGDGALTFCTMVPTSKPHFTAVAVNRQRACLEFFEKGCVKRGVFSESSLIKLTIKQWCRANC